MNASVQGQVLGLVRERVDVGARVLGGDDDPGGAGARLRSTARVVAVEEVVEARGVRGMRRRTRVAKLLEVEDARLLDRVEERFDHVRD